MKSAEDPGFAGATVWFTGLPSSGKTTIAQAVAADARGRGLRVEVLDGDAVRAELSRGLGFSKEDRLENVRRIGWVAHLLARNGVLVLVPVIAPYAVGRDAVRELHRSSGVDYFEVHVSTPVEVCAARDVKGLYARQARGELTGLTGVDDPYEIPIDPELRLEAHVRSVAECAAAVGTMLGMPPDRPPAE